jgi:hypothetical protein
MLMRTFEGMLKFGFLVVLCFKLYSLVRFELFVNEIRKYLLKTSKYLLNFVGKCHMGLD